MALCAEYLNSLMKMLWYDSSSRLMSILLFLCLDCVFMTFIVTML